MIQSFVHQTEVLGRENKSVGPEFPRNRKNNNLIFTKQRYSDQPIDTQLDVKLQGCYTTPYSLQRYLARLEEVIC
jgi:hypothetical protein